MRSLLRCAVMLCVLAGSVSTLAAPTTTLGEGEAEVAPVVDPGAKASPKAAAVDAAAIRDVPNPSNTIQMHLELQAGPEESASAAGSGRAATRSAGSRPAGQPAAANPFGNADNPFNASQEIARPSAGASAARAVEWNAATNSAGFTGGFGGAPAIVTTAPDPHQFGPPRRSGSSSADAEPSWWMPSAWIRWVREHRQEVLIGAAVALALAWAGASRSSARRP